jgi:hypothetical protein
MITRTQLPDRLNALPRSGLGSTSVNAAHQAHNQYEASMNGGRLLSFIQNVA